MVVLTLEIWQNLAYYKTVLRVSEITNSLAKGRSEVRMWRSESVCGISDSTNGPCAGLKQAKGGQAERPPNQATVTLNRE
jgi:hypothetical protein